MPQAAPTLRKTPNFDFIFGRYTHANHTIPYFQVSISFEDAAQYLKLVSEMPGADSINWQIEELFQRDIDWQRVEKKIVPYLKQQEQPQFFNSITIALLPTSDGAFRTYSEEQEWKAPKLANQELFDDGAIQELGPVTCGYWQSWDDAGEDGARLGQLCWNTDQVCGVAIDGQHRLAAIKQVAGPGGAYSGTTVPVIFIVLHPKLGYATGGTRDELIQELRTLFIDLNKHARTVNRARQILLDDRDPAAICVRALVGNGLTTGASELQEHTPSLPLSMVDWHSEQAKFDTGPYLTTILGLDWLVTKGIQVRAVQDHQDWMSWDKLEKSILHLERQVSVDLSTAKIRLEDCRKYERPFFFHDEPENELKKIRDGFCQNWAMPTVHLLTELSPYRQLVDLRQKQGSLTPEFANWFSLKQKADDARGAGEAARVLDTFERTLANRETSPIARGELIENLEACETLKKENQLAFTVVFQRALIVAFRQFLRVSSSMVANGGEDDVDIEDILSQEDDEDLVDEGHTRDEFTHSEQRARELVDALNHLVAEEHDILHVGCEFPAGDGAERLWLCSLAQPDGPIDFTQAASGRAADILLLAGLFWLYRENEGLREDDYDRIMKRADDADGGLDLKLTQCLGRLWTSNTSSVAARILISREEDARKTDPRWREIDIRAKWLWQVICRGA
jgi:DGQHR domain-containing protein